MMYNAPHSHGMGDKSIILFDGHCAFCNRCIQWVLQYERSPTFLFAGLQSEVAAEYLQVHTRDPLNLDSVYLIQGGQLYDKSTAALKIVADFRKPWCWFTILLYIPRPIRDCAYDLFGRWRYRLFGQSEYCVATKNVDTKRFLG